MRQRTREEWRGMQLYLWSPTPICAFMFRSQRVFTFLLSSAQPWHVRIIGLFLSHINTTLLFPNHFSFMSQSQASVGGSMRGVSSGARWRACEKMADTCFTTPYCYSHTFNNIEAPLLENKSPVFFFNIFLGVHSWAIKTCLFVARERWPSHWPVSEQMKQWKSTGVKGQGQRSEVIVFMNAAQDWMCCVNKTSLGSGCHWGVRHNSSSYFRQGGHDAVYWEKKTTQNYWRGLSLYWRQTCIMGNKRFRLPSRMWLCPLSRSWSNLPSSCPKEHFEHVEL